MRSTSAPGSFCRRRFLSKSSIAFILGVVLLMLPLLSLFYFLPIAVHAQESDVPESATDTTGDAAQASPQAGDETEPPPETAPASPEGTDPEDVSDEAGFSVLVQDIRITGNTIIDTATLQEKVQEYKGQELTLEEMGEVADLITIAYQEQGYILARAYLPEQEIEEGVLEIAVSEGKIGKITVSGGRHFDQRVIKRYFQAQEKMGVIREDMLERGILLSNDVPKLKTDIVLREGEKPGEVDVVVNAQDSSDLTFGVDFSLDYNNFGSALVSRDRYGIRVNVIDHKWGSLLSFRGVTGNTVEDSTLITFDYTVPVNSYGTKVIFHYLGGNYVVGQEFADLDVAGNTQFYGVELTHPFIKKKNMNLNLSLRYEHKYQEQEQLGELSNIDEVDALWISANFDNLDRFLGKNFASLEYYYALLEEDDQFPPSRELLADSYQRLMLNAARIQKLWGYSNILGRVYAQYTPDRVLPMDQAILGGYGSVRGHEPSEFIGDYGYSLSLEYMFAPPFIAEKSLFGQRLSQLVQFALFYDHGGVYNNDPQELEFSSQHLSGYGAGVRIFYKDRFNFKYDLGIPVDPVEGAPDLINYFTGQVTFF